MTKSNIGHVQYQFANDLTSLNAVWCHADYRSGVGLAKLLTENRQNSDFVGDYNIQYFDECGLLQADLTLKVRKQEEIYIVHWFDGNVMSAAGVGHELNGVLSVGYRDI